MKLLPRNIPTGSFSPIVKELIVIFLKKKKIKILKSVSSRCYLSRK